MPDIHSHFPPSAADRYLHCPKAYFAEKNVPNTTSAAAEEGTLAHSLAEYKLRILTGTDDGEGISKEEADEIVKSDKQMDEYTDGYIEFIKEQAEIMMKDQGRTTIYPEQIVSFGEYVEGGFGTADCIVVGRKILHIIDFKYGSNVRVDWRDNVQLKIYALGAWSAFKGKYPDVKTVRMSIYQPRMRNFGTFEMTLEELVRWGEEELKPRAELAVRNLGEANEGPWCAFCKAKSVCILKVTKMLEEAKELPIDKTPLIITDDQIKGLLPKLKEISSWCDSLYSLAEADAIQKGKEWPGFCIEEGRRTNIFENPESVVVAAEKAGVDVDELMSLKTPAQIKKIVGTKVFNEAFEDLVTSKPGNPKLVPIKDSKPSKKK